jgi:transcriptional regulator with XRE-family HTH domain
MQNTVGTTGDAGKSNENEHPLRAYRRKHGLSQDAIAQTASTTKATISRIEAGSLDPTFDLMRRLLAATKGEISADELIAWSPPPGQTRAPDGTDKAAAETP